MASSGCAASERGFCQNAWCYVDMAFCPIDQSLGGNLGNLKISLMVSIEVRIHKHFSGPQNYNPGVDVRRQVAWRGVESRHSAAHGLHIPPRFMDFLGFSTATRPVAL